MAVFGRYATVATEGEQLVTMPCPAELRDALRRALDAACGQYDHAVAALRTARSPLARQRAEHRVRDAQRAVDAIGDVIAILYRRLTALREAA